MHTSSDKSLFSHGKIDQKFVQQMFDVSQHSRDDFSKAIDDSLRKCFSETSSRMKRIFENQKSTPPLPPNGVEIQHLTQIISIESQDLNSILTIIEKREEQTGEDFSALKLIVEKLQSDVRSRMSHALSYTGVSSQFFIRTLNYLEEIEVIAYENKASINGYVREHGDKLVSALQKDSERARIHMNENKKEKFKKELEIVRNRLEYYGISIPSIRL